MSLDRLAFNQLSMTQELIGKTLGVRREGVAEAAGKLQNAGLIQYSRGRSPCWIGRAWRLVRANATRWSRPSSTICFQHQQRATLWPRGRMLKRSTSNLQQRAVPRTPRLSNTANSCAHGFQGFFTARYAASLGTTNNTVGNG